MTPLHVDAPEKQLATTWTVEGVFLFRALWPVCEVASEVSAYYCWMTRI